MKHLILTLFCASALTLDVSGQIFSNDGAMMMPTRDLYSDWQSFGDIANAARMAAAADHRRKSYFEDYVSDAYDFFNQGDYYNCLHSSSLALETGYYTPHLFYIRGLAFERIGNYREAKKMYRKAKRKGFAPAKTALEALKQSKKK